MLPTAFILCVLVPSFVNAYFLVGMRNVITQQRLDPIVSPGKVSAHAHAVVGGSNFGIVTNTSNLRQSTCTSNPIVQDKSAYWFPMLYFQWANGSFSSVSGGSVIYYLFDDKPGVTTAFPDDFRMISGTPNLRTYNASSYAQQAVSFLCLDFKGNSVRSTGFPQDPCASGVRAQINFPSCWDGKNVDSEDHQSHVAFRSTGPDSGDCSDPNFPVTLPRIFMEYYLDTVSWDKYRSQAMNPKQPYVYSMGDPTGYGYHADYMYGWDKGVLQKVVDQCHCDPFGDPDCCAKAGLFDLQPEGVQCHITDTVDEQTTGMLSKLPGNNPVQPAGTTAVTQPATSIPALLAPVYAYTGNNPPGQGKIVTPAQNNLPSTQPAPAPPTEAAPAPAKPEPVEPAPASNPASKSNSSNTSSPKTPKTCGRGYRKRRSLGREVVKRHLDSHIHARSRMQSHAF